MLRIGLFLNDIEGAEVLIVTVILRVKGDHMSRLRCGYICLGEKNFLRGVVLFSPTLPPRALTILLGICSESSWSKIDSNDFILK
ncbi:hypothetical protein Tco_0116494 [Tanacetum coccineum]